MCIGAGDSAVGSDFTFDAVVGGWEGTASTLSARCRLRGGSIVVEPYGLMLETINVAIWIVRRVMSGIVAREERDFTRCEVVGNDVARSRVFPCSSYALQAVPQRGFSGHADTDHPS